MAEKIPSWTPSDERELARLQERKETRARMLSQRVEEVADEIIIRNMSSTELASELTERAMKVTRVLRPFLEGPFTAMVIPVGKVVPEQTASNQFSRMGLREWTHRGILEALDADGWVTSEFLNEITPDEVDGQGNGLYFRETLRIDANVATLRCNKETPPGYLMIVRIPEGEGEY